MSKRNILVIMLSILLTSCSVNYILIYKTELKNPKSNNLHYEDEKFSFDFIPFYNGIYFSIKNEIDSTASLIWDKSYFITPEGNSFKALNIDLLNEQTETLLKGTNESIIPSKSIFARFTTPTTNIGKITYAQMLEITSYLAGSQFSYTNVNTKNYVTAGCYWTVSVEKNESCRTCDILSESLNRVSEFIKKNNSLGLGIVISQGIRQYEYRFDFKVVEIDAYNERGAKNEYICNEKKQLELENKINILLEKQDL